MKVNNKLLATSIYNKNQEINKVFSITAEIVIINEIGNFRGFSTDRGLYKK